MKHFTTHMTFAVAALAITASSVSAQTLMKAEIPFAFHVGKQIMQPGEYQVRVLPTSSGSPVLSLANYDSGKSVIVLAVGRTDPGKGWKASGLPKLSFVCGDGPCSLAKAWSGEGDAYAFNPPRGKNGDLHIAEITLRPERAD